MTILCQMQHKKLTKEGLNAGQESLPAKVLAKNFAQIGDIERILSLCVIACGNKRSQTSLEHLGDGHGLDLRQVGGGVSDLHLGTNTSLQGFDQGRLNQSRDDLEELVMLERDVDHCRGGGREGGGERERRGGQCRTSARAVGLGVGQR